jgi:hypothetical protein
MPRCQFGGEKISITEPNRKPLSKPVLDDDAGKRKSVLFHLIWSEKSQELLRNVWGAWFRPNSPKDVPICGCFSAIIARADTCKR